MIIGLFSETIFINLSHANCYDGKFLLLLFAVLFGSACIKFQLQFVWKIFALL